MANKDHLILIGFAEALSAPEVIWCLLDAGFHVAAFTGSKNKTPLHKLKSIDLVPVTPLKDDARKTLVELQKLYKDLNASVILPLNDSAVWLCNKLSDNRDINVAGPTGLQAQFALDKRMQIKAARDAGFNVPETFFIESVADAKNIVDYPVVVKSAMAVAELEGRPIGKESMSFCNDRHEFAKAIESWSKRQPLIAQAVHKGTGEGLFGFATENDIVLWTAHQRIRMMNPKGSGASACRSIPITDHPVSSVKKMLLQLQWRGLFMIELLRDAQGKLWFIELNGRSWGSMALALRMGFDYPAWTVMKKLDPTFIPPRPAPREYVDCRHLGRELIHILQVLRGPSSAAIPNWPPIWNTLSNVLRIGKNDQWYNWRKGHAGFFISDTYNTVLNETLRKWI